MRVTARHATEILDAVRNAPHPPSADEIRTATGLTWGQFVNAKRYIRHTIPDVILDTRYDHVAGTWVYYIPTDWMGVDGHDPKYTWDKGYMQTRLRGMKHELAVAEASGFTHPSLAQIKATVGYLEQLLATI